jgi:hypothetical protein
MIIEKETAHMGKLSFQLIDRTLAKDIIINNHYSHKWNTSFGKINVGIIKDERVLGVASFGNLMNPNSYQKISSNFNKDSIIELNRLWIDDELGKNAESLLIGASWKIIRNEYPYIKCVQSFADGRLGCGTIYKATNFKYYGYTESLFFENIETGETQHKVPFENTLRPIKMVKLNSLYCQGKLKPFIVKTYRYMYPLYKNVIINLKEMNYPEYSKGYEYQDDYKVNISNLVRSYLLAKIMGDDINEKIIKDYIIKNFNNNQIVDSIFYNFKNQSILLMAKRFGKEEFLNIYIEETTKTREF